MLGSNWKKRTLLFSLVATLLLLFTGLSPGVVHADGEDEEGSDYSFYMKASQLSEAFEQEVSPQSATDSNAGSSLLMNSNNRRIKTGQAGGLLGYSESTSDQKGVYGWLHSELSTNSASYNYSQLRKISSRNANGDLEETGVLVSYAYYGKTLSDLGFDNTASSGASIGRLIAGSFLYLVYIIASIAPMFFVWGIKLIKLLNPFQLVGAAFAGLSNAQVPGFLGTTIEYVSKIYKALENMSTFVILPVMIGVTVFSIFMFRRTSASKKLVRLAVRALMMFGGVAIIGSTFTGLLDKLDDMTSSGTQYADFVVLSSFVDFESWAQNTRLALPSSGSYGALGNTFKSTSEGESSMSKSRQSTALLINAMANNDGTLLNMYKSMDASSAFNVFDEANDSIGSGGGKYNKTKQLKATSILVSYLKGELYYSSAYEGYAKADYGNDNVDSVVSMFEKLPTVLSGKSKDKIGLLGGVNSGIDSNTKDSSIYSAGSLGRTGNNVNGFFQSAPLEGNTLVPTVGSGASAGGLTPMSMYNYLNTKFGSTNLVVYSPVKSSSSYVKESHRSVNFVGGTGALMFIGYLETAVVLIFLATISLIYAFGLIQVAFGSIARILPGIFGSAVGSIGFITKLLVSVVVLLVEIIGTVLLYGITQYLSISVMVNLNTIFQYDKLSISASMMEAVKSIIVIVIMILLMYISFKNRTKFVKAMEETVTNIITKLMGALDSNINEGNALGNNSEAIKSGVQSGTGQNKENNGTGVKDLYTASKANMEKRDRLGQMQGNAPMSKTDKAVGMASTMGRMAGAKSKDTAAEMFGIKGHALDTEMAMEDMKMSALENDTRSAMTAGGNNIQQNEQNADYDPDYDDVNGLSGDGTQAFDDDSGLADYEANDSEQSVVTDDNGNSASGVRGVESSDDFDDFDDDDDDFSGVNNDDPRGPKGPKDPKSAGKTIKAGEAATVGAAGALARGNRKNKDDKDKNSDSKSKSKQDTNGKNGKSSDQNKDGKSIKAGESAGKDGVKSGKPGSQNIKPGAAQGNGKKKDQTDADGKKRTSDDNGSSLNQRTGKPKTPNVGEAAGSNIGVKPNGASENGAIPGNKRRGNRLDNINTNDSEFDDTDDVMDSDGTESMVFQLNSDNSLSGFDAIDGQSSGQSGKPAGQAKRPGFAQRRLSNTKRRVQKAAESVATVAGAAKEGFGDGRYGETGHDLRKAEKVVRKQAWQANKNQTGNPVTRTYKQAVGAHNMKQTAKNLRSQGQDPSSVLRGGSGYHGSNAGQSGVQNRGPITKFANGSDIRVMRNVPLSKSANSLNLTESTPLSPERVQGRINNLVNDYNVGSYDTYKASLRDSSQQVAAYKSDMTRAHTALNKAKTGNNFDKNSVAQLQQVYNQAKANYNQANSRRRDLRKNSVALVHTEGMPSSVVIGSKFKGDPIYARNTLNNLARVQQEQSKLRRSISSSSRYGRDTTKAKARLNELNVDQSKLQGVLRNSGFDMDYLDSPKSVIKAAQKFEIEFKDYIDGKR